MNNMRRLVLNIMFISNTADGNTNNDINQSVNNNISSTDDSNKTISPIYIIISISIAISILGIVIYFFNKKQKENIKKLEGEVKELKKYSEDICGKEDNGSWKVKSDSLQENFVQEVQEKLIEVIDIMTQIKINNKLFLIWWVMEENNQIERSLDNAMCHKIKEQNYNNFLACSLSFLPTTDNQENVIIFYPTNKNHQDYHEVGTYSIQNCSAIKSFIQYPFYDCKAEDKNFIYDFFDKKLYQFFTKYPTEYSGLAKFWKLYQEKILSKTGEEQDRARRYMLLAQKPGFVTFFLNPIRLEALEEKLKELEK